MNSVSTLRSRKIGGRDRDRTGDPLLAKQSKKHDVVDSSSLYLCHVAPFLGGVWGLLFPFCFHIFVASRDPDSPRYGSGLAGGRDEMNGATTPATPGKGSHG